MISICLNDVKWCGIMSIKHVTDFLECLVVSENEGEKKKKAR